MIDDIEFIREKCIAANPEIATAKCVYGCQEGHLVLPDYSEVPGGCPNCVKQGQYEPFGRPIRLADVLLAIEKAQGESEYVVMADGHFIKYSTMNEVGYLVYEATKYFWNLHDDDLEKQSEITRKFIRSILEQK